MDHVHDDMFEHPTGPRTDSNKSDESLQLSSPEQEGRHHRLTRAEQELKRCLPANVEERILKNYSCALQRDILVQGRMHITPNYICFYTNLFLYFEKKEVISFREVISITKGRTAKLFPNAILIETDKKKFFFATFNRRNKTYSVLQKVWANARADQPLAFSPLRELIRSRQSKKSSSKHPGDGPAKQDEEYREEEEEEEDGYAPSPPTSTSTSSSPMSQTRHPHLHVPPTTSAPMGAILGLPPSHVARTTYSQSSSSFTSDESPEHGVKQGGVVMSVLPPPVGVGVVVEHSTFSESSTSSTDDSETEPRNGASPYHPSPLVGTGLFCRGVKTEGRGGAGTVVGNGVGVMGRPQIAGELKRMLQERLTELRQRNYAQRLCSWVTVINVLVFISIVLLFVSSLSLLCRLSRVEPAMKPYLSWQPWCSCGDLESCGTVDHASLVAEDVPLTSQNLRTLTSATFEEMVSQFQTGGQAEAGTQKEVQDSES